MIPRAKYKDGTHAESVSEGYDVIQLKYDGNFCYVLSDDNVQDYFSDTNRLVETKLDTCPNGIFIGELMRGTQWSKDPTRHGSFYVFDMYLPNEFASFRDRYSRLAAMRLQLPKHWVLVQNYRITARDSIWEQYVVNSGFEGLVYRRSKDPIACQLIREKRVFTLDGQVTGFTQGEGKHEGRLGSIQVRLDSGATATVGSGWSDEEREYIYNNMDRYQGKWMELTANAIFESGNVRHARFIRWRTDKDL